MRWKQQNPEKIDYLDLEKLILESLFISFPYLPPFRVDIVDGSHL